MTRTIFAQPPITACRLGKIPEPVCSQLDNSIPLYIFNFGNEEVIQIDFTFDAGFTKSNFPLIPSITNLMLVEGTNKRAAHQFNETVDFYGIELNLFCTGDKAGVSISCLNKYLDKAIELVHEMLFSPLFGENELDTVIGKQRNGYLVSREVMANLSKEKLFSTIFGENHPYGKNIELTDFKDVNTGQLKQFHTNNYIPNNLYIVVSGQVPTVLVPLLNSFFGKLPYSISTENSIVPTLPTPTSSRIHVEKGNAVQTSIKIGSLTIDKKEKDYPGLKVVNTILGGYFGSRLMKNLREEKGFTYGIGSGIYSFQLAGVKVISTDVNQANTTEAIDEILKEIHLLSIKPVEQKELEIVRNYMLGTIVRSLDGPFALAANFKSLYEFGLDNLFMYKMEEKIKSIGPDEIMSLVNTYYKIDGLTIVTAGKE